MAAQEGIETPQASLRASAVRQCIRPSAVLGSSRTKGMPRQGMAGRSVSSNSSSQIGKSRAPDHGRTSCVKGAHSLERLVCRPSVAIA